MNAKELRALMEGKITWERDLDDDCVASFHGLHAHAEKMNRNSWYCSVYRVGNDGRGSDVFHTADNDIHPLTGRAARDLCERIMRLEAIRDVLPLLLDLWDAASERLRLREESCPMPEYAHAVLREKRALEALDERRG